MLAFHVIISTAATADESNNISSSFFIIFPPLLQFVLSLCSCLFDATLTAAAVHDHKYILLVLHYDIISCCIVSITASASVIILMAFIHCLL